MQGFIKQIIYSGKLEIVDSYISCYPRFASLILTQTDEKDEFQLKLLFLRWRRSVVARKTLDLHRKPFCHRVKYVMRSPLDTTMGPTRARHVRDSSDAPWRRRRWNISVNVNKTREILGWKDPSKMAARRVDMSDAYT